MNTMNRHMAAGARRVCVIVLAACCVAATAAGLPEFPPGLSKPAKSLVMPAFELPTTTGALLHSSGLRGQVVIVRYWASW
jgi:hypothetical protein